MYKIGKFENIIRVEDKAHIPSDPINIDYQQYLAWVAQGNTPEPYIEPPPPIPQSLTQRQARVVLIRAGYLATVETVIANMPGVSGDEARITWEFATEIRRDDPLLVQISGLLNLTTEQIDQMFIDGSTI